MQSETRTTDTKARLTLPKQFASSTVIVEHVSPTELRIRRARVVAEDDLPTGEVIRLSRAEWERFVAVLDAPPKPNAALKALFKKPEPKKKKPRGKHAGVAR